MSKTAALLLLCTALFAQQKGTFTDTRDGKTYKTTKIGKYVWMAENLNYETEGSKCYDNKSDNCKKYGRLYDWYMAMKACPSGWHLPTNEEWKILSEIVDGDCWRATSTCLRATSGWNDYKGKSGNGIDKYGFSALPGGRGFSEECIFVYVGECGYWWSANEKESNTAFFWSINKSEDFYPTHYGKGYLQSVRCLQD